MNNRHLMHALRTVAPVALLFLAACTEKAQVANATQEVMDAKNPGVVGMIKNAAGASTGNPETDAALGAEDAIRKVQQSDRLQAEAIAARDRGDPTTAQDKIQEIFGKGNRSPNNLLITSLGIALQYGQPDANEKLENLKLTQNVDKEQATDGNWNRSQMRDAEEGIKESERVLKALSQMNLSPQERRSRQANAAAAAAEYYGYEAALYRIKARQAHNSMDDHVRQELAEYAEKQQQYYHQMERDLRAGD